MSPLGLGPGMRRPGDITKADTLLAAFASIDAESEQVAEETTIDSSALRALAEAKRPNVLATLRRKFSSGVNSPSTRSNDRGSDGEEMRAVGSVRGDLALSLDSRGAGRLGTSGSRLGSGPTSRVPTALSSLSGLLTKNSLGSRHSSMLMDYFSEEYSLSSSSSDDDERVAFEDIFDNKARRYTEDRKPQSPQENRSLLSFRSMRKSQNRSFESLERTESGGSLSDTQDTDDLDDISVPPREHSRAGAKDKMETLPLAARDDRQPNLPMSTSTVSSDKRPRSSAAYSRAGPSIATRDYSDRVIPDEEQVSVHMEDEPLAPTQNELPDRMDYFQSSRIAQRKVPPFPGGKTDTRRERSTPSGGSISVHMEEAPSPTGRVDQHANNEYPQKSYPSATDSGKGRAQVPAQTDVERRGDMVSVYMEDASLHTRPTRLGAKTFPSVESPRDGIPRPGPGAAQKTLKQRNTAEDVSVHMENAPAYDVRGDSKRYQGQTSGTQGRKRNSVPVSSEKVRYTTPVFAEGDTVLVQMEDEMSPRSSVRAKINAFDQSEKRARRYSEASSSQMERGSNVSVAKLKNMWNEIARRNSEEGS